MLSGHNWIHQFFPLSLYACYRNLHSDPKWLMWFYFLGHCDPMILVRSFWSYSRHSYLSYISYLQDGYLILFLFVISHPRISLIRFIYHGLKFTTPGSLIGLIQDLKLMEKVFYVLSLRSEFWSSFSMVSLFHRDCLAPSIQHWWLLARVQRDARMEPPSGNFKRPLNQFKIRNPLLLLKIDGAAAVWLHSKIVDYHPYEIKLLDVWPTKSNHPWWENPADD